MSDDTSFDDVAKWGAIMLGMILAVPIVIVLSNQAPFVLVTALLVGFLGWAGIRTGILVTDDSDAEAATDADPLTTLQDRYAAGELSEVEFERRLDRILESDQQAERAGEPTRDRSGTTGERGEREPSTERE